MPSARTQCPACQDDAHVVDLRDLLYSPQVDYFRCRDVWVLVDRLERRGLARYTPRVGKLGL